VSEDIQSEATVIIRKGVEDDHRLIYATWLKGLYNGNDWFRMILQDRFYEYYHKVIENILARPHTDVRIACFADRPDVILGYSVQEGERLHWVFVKASFRRFGIAKRLIPDTITTCTHLTRLAVSLRPKSWSFDPFF
jgi:GNAT superfamily N-acetyltransferase